MGSYIGGGNTVIVNNMAASKGGIIESEVISCCICLNSQPILNQIDQTLENEVITPFFKLFICVPEVVSF